MASPLVRWLCGLTPDELAEILLRRPETLADPVPGSLTALAVRLQDRRHVLAALHRLPLPAVQLIEIIQAYGTPAAPVRWVAEALRRPPSDPDLTATLAALAKRALVWPDGEELRMSGPLWTAFAHPLGLGEPAARLLGRVPMSDLRHAAGTLGLPAGQGRAATAQALAERLAGPGTVVTLVADAPPATRALLARAAVDGPLVAAPLHHAGGPRDLPDGAGWALARGLLLPDGWEHLHLPGEVGRALRGPSWHAPFDPRPPELATSPVGADAVAGEAAAAASAAVTGLSALLAECATAPAALRKAGGVGVREVRRLARASGCGEPAVRLLLELAYAAGLLGTRDGQVVPTDAYDAWAVDQPAARLAVALRAWPSLPAIPLRDGDDGDAPVPLCEPDPTAAQLRADLLCLLAELPGGVGAVGPDTLAGALHWRAPRCTGDRATAGRLVTGLWREALLLGVVAHGALTPLGHALRTTPGEVAATVEGLLPAPAREAVFQADLTAVVVGLPDPALAALLDAVGARESRDAAATWRLSEESVRRALDAGHTGDGLLDDLRAVAAGGALPQALEYLVADLARRHGRLRVREVRSVLHAADPALVAQVCGTRALRHLGLTGLAPTVLGSARPADETLAALRAAGYAPVGEDAAGGPLVERPARLRAAAPVGPPGTAHAVPTPRAGRGGGAAAEPAALALSLLAAARRGGDHPLDGLVFESARPEPPSNVIPLRRRGAPAETTSEAIDRYAAHLDRAERRRLAEAVESGEPVTIEYTDSSGYATTRLVEPLELDRHLLTAWCHLRGDERVFALDRIEAVLPG